MLSIMSMRLCDATFAEELFECAEHAAQGCLQQFNACTELLQIPNGCSCRTGINHETAVTQNDRLTFLCPGSQVSSSLPGFFKICVNLIETFFDLTEFAGIHSATDCPLQFVRLFSDETQVSAQTIRDWCMTEIVTHIAISTDGRSLQGPCVVIKVCQRAGVGRINSSHRNDCNYEQSCDCSGWELCHGFSFGFRAN
jgi:hypothetical protein